MSASRLLTKSQEDFLHQEYHMLLTKSQVLKTKPKLKDFFISIRLKNSSFEHLSDRVLTNKIIALRRVDGEEEWPNISQITKYLSPDVRNLVSKARNAALIAVEIYNKPAVPYRSETYIIMMMIAWTSLFHAIFKKAGENIQYSDKLDGYFDLRKCINKYNGILKKEVEANLNILIEIRDIIVHRDNPVLDERLFANCQSCLFNFEAIITKYFGHNYKLNYSLAYSLQFSKEYSEEQLNAIKSYKNRNYYEVMEFLNQYEKNLSNNYPEIYSSPHYAFRVYMIPKIAKPNQADAAIEYINYDITNKSQSSELEKVLVMFKESRTAGGNYFKAGEISDIVYSKLKDKKAKGWKFNASYHHSKCAKYFKIREGYKTNNPEKTKKEYCQYEPVFEQYIYTQQWIDFLVKKLEDEKVYNVIFSRKK